MKLNQSAFTIIELLIATAVFTIILILTTTTIIGISQTYIKGSVVSQTQDSAGDILNDISQDIEYNNSSTINTLGLYTVVGGANTPNQNSENEYYFCIGDDVYAYSFDVPLNTSATTTNYNIGLVRYSSTTCPASISNVPTTLSAFGTMEPGYEELLVQNERIGGLYVCSAISTSSCVVDGQTIDNVGAYSIALEIGYATNTSNGNALISDTGSYQNGESVPPANYTYPYQCLSGNDSSFCAVTNLTTTAVPRIND